MKLLATSFLLLTFFLNAGLACAQQVNSFPLDARRILFLGDSITHAGHYISTLERELRLSHSGEIPELINLGLPSETCSGLSEPDHPFPRPDVHERIDRALEKIHPDVVVACYGMNDGIYYPFSEERFAKYQQGIRDIIKKVHASGAKLILMTPPAFDPLPLKEQGKLLPAGQEKYAWFSIYEDYDSVMKQYAGWIMTLGDEVEMLIDLHTPVNAYVTRKRQQNPNFTMSPDGVHVNEEGHSVLAQIIMQAWGMPDSDVQDSQLDALTHQRQMLMHSAWLSHVGHKRPGVKAGPPLEEALKTAKQIDANIQERLVRLRPLLMRDDSQQGEKIHHLYYPASTNAGELSLGVDFYLWLPPGVEKIRGIIVHQHGCGDGASKGGATAANDLHWRELAKKWDCALLGSSYDARQGVDCRAWCDSRRGSADRFVQALGDFASLTGHPEIAEVPWCLWGHSGGGFWASLMQVTYPERIAAIWLQSGQAYSRWVSGEIPAVEIPPAAYGIPVVACPGFKEKDHERFHVAWDGCLEMFHAYRKQNAPFVFAPDPRTGHECGDSRYLAIPFFDACLEQRLPPVGTNSQRLRPIKVEEGVLATLDGRQITSATEFTGDHSQATWLPSLEFATAWKEFITTGSVGDTTPPPATTNVVVTPLPNGMLRLSWNADADFESGIAAFHIKKGEQIVAKIPTETSNRFGRPLFQRMSYHDTPEQPLPQMSVEFDALKLNGAMFEVIAINSAGLKSSPTLAKFQD